ncbi:hypothetical protein Y032_0359g3418 [Ancylostoma ceylanicum]|uniref:Uncharacterized protein n=1 Tax=Ancylostoma ceylanicum TaxID=53326 RepID=A0A016RVP5_9BILA|nr:hypothetical protein Y032_0359g3418 [Ancylostoma ceylanicum]
MYEEISEGKMFRKPSDDDYLGSRKIVKAKPLPTKYSEKLSMTGKDFVSSGSEGGSGHRESTSQPHTSTATVLTDDEKNKIHAKILKAEMKGDVELVKKLKRRLEEGTTSDNSVVLMKRSRSGNVVPARSGKDSSQFAESSSRIHREYQKQQNVRDMVQEEKSSTAEDQLMLFHRSIIKSAKVRRHDDESLDDIAEMQKESRKRKEKDERISMDRRRRGMHDLPANPSDSFFSWVTHK